MSSKKKKMLAQVKQNKTNRVENKEKKYEKTQRSKSDKAYIEGDYKSSVSKRSYGIKKQIAEGNDVKGYGKNYVDTKGMSRSSYNKLQRGENPYEAKYVYTGKPSVIKNKDGSMFTTRNRFMTNDEKKSYNETGTLNDQKYAPKQKYAIMSSANPSGTKFTDHLNTFKADGLATAKANQREGQHIKNAGQWIAGGLKDILDIPIDVMKGADYGMGQITGAVSGALEQSGNVFTSIAEGKNNINKGLIKRNMEESRKESDATGWGHGFGKYFNDVADRSDKKYNVKQTDREKTKRENILNIAGLGADILNPITIEGVLKPLTKGVTSSFNDMVKGTADISTSFVPKELTNLKGQYSNKLRKASGASDDVFYNGKAIESTAESARLDNAYKNAVNKTEPIKTGKTKLDGFLSQLKQRRVGNAEEGGMFPYNANKFNINSGEQKLSKIDDVLESFGDDYKRADAFMDNLQKKNPKLYNEYVGISDRVNDMAEIGQTKQLLNDNYTKSINGKLGNNIKDRRTINVDNTKPLTSAPIQARKSLGENSVRFKNFTQHYVDQKLPKMSFAEKEMTIATLKDMSRKTTKSNQDKTIQALNKMLFDGENVIRNNVPKHDLKQFSNYMIDTITYQDALDNGVAKIKVHNKDGKLVNFNVFDKKGNVNQLENKINMFANNMVDDLFEDKKSIKANAVGVKYKSEITKPLKELQEKMKKGDLTPVEQKKYTDLKMREELWDTIHKETRDLEFDEFNKYVEDKFPHLSQNKAYKDAVDETALNYRNTLPDVDKLNYEEKQMSQIKYKEVIDRVKESADIKYVDYKNTKVDPNLKQTNKMVMGTKWTRDSIENIQKYITEEMKLISSGKAEDAKFVREEMQKVVHKLREKGVDDNAYFDQIKQYKLNLLKQSQEKPRSATALDKLGIKINGKNISDPTALSADELQAKYLFTEGAKTFDELFEAVDPKIAQHGDNVGNEISSLIRPNNMPKNPLEAIIEKENIADSKKVRERITSEAGEASKNRLYPKELEGVSRGGLDDYYNEIFDRIKSNGSDIDVPTNVNPETGEILSKSKSGNFKVSDEIASTVEELKSAGIDVSKEPPKTKPKDMSPNLYKKWLNAWKKGVTVYSPGWHVQNFFQNKGQNYLALGNQAFAPQTEARQILKEIQSGKNMSNKAVRAKELNVLGEFGEDFVSQNTGLMSKIDNSKIMQKLGENEQTARLHHWLTQIDRGMSEEDALKSVNKYLFDYSGKNDKSYDKVMKNVDPFWTFHKNNAKLMVDSGLRHPSRMGNIRRGVDGLDNALTDENRQNEESSYGRTQLPGATYHDDVSNADFNYMYKQQTLPEFEDGIPTTQEDFENKMNPLLRIALQTAKGEGNFGNKLTTNEEAKWGETTIPDRLKEIAMELNPILPTLFNTIDKSKSRQEKADNDKVGQEITDKQILNDWIKYITGHKGNWYRNM